MAAAARAMGRAVTSLEALKTGDALPPEMEALNHLLKAQADIKRRQLSMNQSAAGAAGNANRNYDISTLFDRELQRQQQTNYETPKGVERPQPRRRGLRSTDQGPGAPPGRIAATSAGAGAGGAVARGAQARAREAHARAVRVASARRGARAANVRTSAEVRSSQPTRGRGAGKTASRNGQTSGGRSNDSNRRQMRDVSEEMRQAASDLRRGAPEQAGASGGRALEKLRDLERRMQSGQPDDRRRALGDMRLEARRLADGQRQVASELGKVPSGDAGKDALRRLAGDQARLAERMRRLQDDVKQQAATAPRGKTGDQSQSAALREVTRDVGGLSDRMQRAADELRGRRPVRRPPGAATAQEIARQLDRLADRLGVANGARDDARKLSEQLARTEELRDKLQQVGQPSRMRAGRMGAPGDRAAQKTSGESGRTGEGRQGRGRNRPDKASRGIAAAAAGREEPARGAASPGSELFAQRRWIHVRRPGDGDVGSWY